MPKNPTVALIRLTIAGAITLAMLALHLAFPGVAFAHHIEIVPTQTCDTYNISANYIGGSSDRIAKVYVNGVLTGTYDFPGSGPDLVEDFFVQSGELPANVTVQVQLYIPHPGPDELESTVSATVDADDTCTPTATATSTLTSTPTETAVPTTTPVPSSTATPDATSTATAVPTSTTTPGFDETVTPAATTSSTVPTATPAASTRTPAPTASNTPAGATTPTYVSTVEALLPPEGPGNSTTPPEETASGLPNAGGGPIGGNFVLGIALVAIAAGGLAVATIALRRPTS